MYFHKWFNKNSPGSMDPVKELWDLIFCLQEMRVTAASVVFNWIQCTIHPLQRQRNFGFQYEGTEDSSWFSAELMEQTEGLRVI